MARMLDASWLPRRHERFQGSRTASEPCRLVSYVICTSKASPVKDAGERATGGEGMQ